jgi:thiamine kinase-like enzyme
MTIPSTSALTAALSSALTADGPRREVAILERIPSVWSASFPAEIVSCRLGDGRELRLLCKYSVGRDRDPHGHRGGLARELQVYRSVLARDPGTTAHLYGAYEAELDGEVWLFLQYLDNGIHLEKSGDPRALPRAASWIGGFHARHEGGDGAAVGGIESYEENYYLGWSRRTARFAEPLHGDFPWLPDACARFPEVVAVLSDTPATLIHAEYHVTNILFRGGTVYPVDWESAAIGPGEIDLAALTERWPEIDVVEACERAYAHARWGGRRPETFGQTMIAARMYLMFRWLGDRPEWTTHERLRWRFDELQRLAELASLI